MRILREPWKITLFFGLLPYRNRDDWNNYNTSTLNKNLQNFLETIDAFAVNNMFLISGQIQIKTLNWNFYRFQWRILLLSILTLLVTKINYPQPLISIIYIVFVLMWCFSEGNAIGYKAVCVLNQKGQSQSLKDRHFTIHSKFLTLQKILRYNILRW